MKMIDWLLGRKTVYEKDVHGIQDALAMIDDFPDAVFTLEDRSSIYRFLSHQRVKEYLHNQLPDYYDYETHIRIVINRKNLKKLHLRLKGHIGLSTELQRYNPMDLTVRIKTM